jgi:hypothetical protein
MSVGTYLVAGNKPQLKLTSAKPKQQTQTFIVQITTQLRNRCGFRQIFIQVSRMCSGLRSWFPGPSSWLCFLILVPSLATLSSGSPTKPTKSAWNHILPCSPPLKRDWCWKFPARVTEVTLVGRLRLLPLSSQQSCQRDRTANAIRPQPRVSHTQVT